MLISIETARRLKEAGLKYKQPMAGDWYYDERVGAHGGTFLVRENYSTRHWLTWREGVVWLPRLEQLLAEIAGRGYFLSLHSVNEDYWDCELYKVGCVYSVDGIAEPKTPDEAAALALLWILEQSVGNSDGN